MKAPLLSLLVCCAVFAACDQRDTATTDADTAPPPPTSLPDSSAAAAAEGTAVAVLAGTAESPVRGELRLTAAGDGVRVVGEVSGLTPGTEHGFHVHEHGDCSAPDASSAGGHLNPGNAQHGGPDMTPRHLGDLPNIKADQDGHAEISALVAAATLRDEGPNNLVGKAFVVHAKADDYKSQPAGNSGDRIACGVVQ